MKSAAARLRRFRERQREGKVVLKIEVDLVDHTEMLIAAGLLRAWDDDEDRATIEAATARLLRALAREEETRFGSADPADV
jgi:hypothetical protein